MKKRAAVLALAVITCAILAAGPLAAAEQVARPAAGEDLKAAVSSFVGRFPAESPAAKDALCAEILGLGPRASPRRWPASSLPGPETTRRPGSP